VLSIADILRSLFGRDPELPPVAPPAPVPPPWAPPPPPKPAATHKSAFGEIPTALLTKIEASAPVLSRDVRGLLLSLFADPNDKSCWAALIDYSMEFVNRPNEVVLDGQKIPTTKGFDYRWWDEMLGDDIAIALLNYVGSPGNSHSSYRTNTLSIDALCAKTAAQLVKIPGIKQARLRKIRTWLRKMGLSLSGDPVLAPPDTKETHEIREGGPPAGHSG
jgi:hypothetical protein